MRTIYYLIALALVIFVSKLVFVNKAEAGGPWNDQYCDVEVTQIRVVDAQGNVIEERTEEKVVCNDGAKDFLHGMGIADSCQIFTWMMPLEGTVIKQRDIACHKMNGEYEIVQGYHSID
jgi:hypothetical protein|tara:strand:+ start:32 stop:388 length:357 start_codon:yes stop_codon:yes gene_type:complete